MPAYLFVHDEKWPFKTILCWRFFKKSFKRHSGLSFMPFYFNSYISLSCHTFSKALGMSSNISLIKMSKRSKTIKRSKMSWLKEGDWKKFKIQIVLEKFDYRQEVLPSIALLSPFSTVNAGTQGSFVRDYFLNVSRRLAFLIAQMLGLFLYLNIVFKDESDIFSSKGSHMISMLACLHTLYLYGWLFYLVLVFGVSAYSAF